MDIIRERWHDNELDVVRAKLGPKVDRITKEQFVRLIPGMSNFSQVIVSLVRPVKTISMNCSTTRRTLYCQ